MSLISWYLDFVNRHFKCGAEVGFSLSSFLTVEQKGKLLIRDREYLFPLYAEVRAGKRV